MTNSTQAGLLGRISRILADMNTVSHAVVDRDMGEHNQASILRSVR